MDIVLASNNAHKKKELSDIISSCCNVNILSLSDIGFTDDIVETGKTFEENARIKAQAVASLGYAAIADDSGLCVDALGGAPGVYSARYSGEPCCDKRNNEKLLLALKGLEREKRGAHYVSVICCIIPGEKEISARGECRGEILTEPQGSGGFGYDPLFLPQGLDKTFAELTAEEKNSISHRAVALKNFMAMFLPYYLKRNEC